MGLGESLNPCAQAGIWHRWRSLLSRFRTEICASLEYPEEWVVAVDGGSGFGRVECRK
jgi:hypothetical protein